MALTLRAFLLFALSFAVSSAAHPADAEQRVAAAYLLAHGRMPDVAEKAGAAQKAALPELLAAERAKLRGADAQREVQARAWRDVFGQAPQELAASAEPQLYIERFAQLVQQLRSDPKDYRSVIERAYRVVVGREAYPEEFKYWSEYPPMPYILLVGALEHWARRNQPGLMVTAGRATLSPQSEFLSTIWLPPVVAEEVRAFLGLPPYDQDFFHYAFGRNLATPGGEAVITTHGVHLLAVGGPLMGRLADGR
jgi:hypothetical protein